MSDFLSIFRPKWRNMILFLMLLVVASLAAQATFYHLGIEPGWWFHIALGGVIGLLVPSSFLWRG